ncbi:hypothetical protein [Streptomyces sp. NPDC002250]|uniref:hypothetical protein n=1 Tax=Streptomyces sp. NPDC002250 TaxID=3364641 RepID=UPI0036B69059
MTIEDRSLNEISRMFRDIADKGEGAVGGAESTGTTGAAGVAGEAKVHRPRSALSDIAEETTLHADSMEPSPAEVHSQPQPDAFAVANRTRLSGVPLPEDLAVRFAAHRQRFRARLGEFRRRRVLVPYGEEGAALTVETHGARWLLAFTDEGALARYALARGERDRAWRYRAVWGAAVLDAGVPAVAGAGLPCGVLVDAGDGERGLVLPPVVGIVPDAVAVDGPGGGTGSGGLGGPGAATGADADSVAGSGRWTGEERS